MSPLSTFHSWGSSSSEYLRSNLPTGVIRGSSRILNSTPSPSLRARSAAFCPSASSTIVRNFHTWNGRPSLPTRVCRKKAGPPSPIRLGDGGPAFFRQTRVGKDGRPFQVWKFRTMVEDAEGQKAALLARNDGDGVLFKMRDDPRITPVGRLLRKYSLDELPQLWNVLKGDMSLVGPRPAVPAEAASYGSYVRRRLVVKPGITGLWQVSGRSDLPWDEAVRLDLRYVENRSLALDLQILWKTWAAVLKGSGAY